VMRTEETVRPVGSTTIAAPPRRIGAIAGVVRGPDRQPIAAATVELLRRLGSDVSGYLPDCRPLTEERRTTTSDANGRFRFDEVPRSATFSLRALAEPALRGKGLSRLRAGDEQVVLDLAPAASLAGRVVDADGNSVADSTVVVDASSDVREVRLREKAKTDEDGEFEMTGLAPGHATASVITPAGNVRFPAFVTLKAGEQARVELTVDGPYGVDGVVIDDETGAPIADAQLLIGLLEGETIARSDGRGRFALRTSETWQGGTRLEVYARGYAPATVAALAEKRIVADFEVRMKPGRSARGRVVFASGLPVANAIVVVKPVYAGSGLHLFKPLEATTTKSAADGTFTVPEIGREGSHVLLVRGDECADTVVPLPADERERDDLDLGDVVVDRGAFVTGRVFDDAGAVVLRPALQLRTAATVDPASPAASGEPSPPLNVALYAWRELEVESDGRFMIPGVARGRWVIRATTGSHPTPATTEFVVDGESDTLEVNCRFDVGLTLTGRVHDEHGVAVPVDLPVMVSATPDAPGPGNSAIVAVGADGRFRLTGLANGAHSLRIYQSGAHAAGMRWLEPIELHGLAGGGPDLDLVMRECAPLRIKVVDEAGAAIKGARVRLLDEEKKERADGHTGEDGVTTVGLVPDSSYRMEIFRNWNLFQPRPPVPDVVRDGVRADGEEFVVRLPHAGS
jgi:carboxypeptidase family protein